MAKLVWRLTFVAELGPELVSKTEVGRIERDAIGVTPETLELTLVECHAAAAAETPVVRSLSDLAETAFETNCWNVRQTVAELQETRDSVSCNVAGRLVVGSKDQDEAWTAAQQRAKIIRALLTTGPKHFGSVAVWLLLQIRKLSFRAIARAYGESTRLGGECWFSGLPAYSQALLS